MMLSCGHNGCDVCGLHEEAYGGNLRIVGPDCAAYAVCENCEIKAIELASRMARQFAGYCIDDRCTLRKPEVKG